MKRKFLIALCCIVCCFSLTACGSKSSDNKGSDNEDYFVIETTWTEDLYTYKIVYAKDTGVRYCIIKTAKGISMTPLYNTDGSIQVSSEWKKKDLSSTK